MFEPMAKKEIIVKESSEVIANCDNLPQGVVEFQDWTHIYPEGVQDNPDYVEIGVENLAWAFRQKIVSLRGEEENVKLYGGARVTSGHSLCHPLRVRNGAEHRGGALSAAAAQQCHCAGGDASLTPAPVGGGPYGGERGQPHFLATVLQSSYG